MKAVGDRVPVEASLVKENLKSKSVSVEDSPSMEIIVGDSYMEGSPFQREKLMETLMDMGSSSKERETAVSSSSCVVKKLLFLSLARCSPFN